MKNRLGLALLFFMVLLTFNAFPTSTFGQASCSAAALKGNFGFVGTGFVPEQLPNHGGVRWDPTSEVGVVNFDGNGKVSLAEHIQYHGKVNPQSGSGTYQVEKECTGGATFKDQNGNVVFSWSFVVTSGGVAIETIEVVSANGNRPVFSITFTQHKT